MIIFSDTSHLKNAFQKKLFIFFTRDENGILCRCKRPRVFNFGTHICIQRVPGSPRRYMDFSENLAGIFGLRMAILVDFSKSMKFMHKPFWIWKKYIKRYSHLIFYAQKVKIGSNRVYRGVCPDALQKSPNITCLSKGTKI